jgi:hypothetical protein
VPHVGLTLEGPKPQFQARTSLDKLNDAIRRSVEGGWLRMLSDKGRLEDLKHVKSWDDLKRWVAEHWNEVIKAVKKQLKDVKVGSGFDLAGALKELEGLKSRLDDDKISREVVAPALLLIQAERLGVDETTLKYFGAVISGTVGGDGSVSAAWKEVSLSSGEGAVALLWAAAWSAYGVRPRATGGGRAFKVVASNDDAVRLAQRYVLLARLCLRRRDLSATSLWRLWSWGRRCRYG